MQIETHHLSDRNLFSKSMHTPTRNPSVLFINRVYPPFRGASGRVLRDLAEGFAKDGWQVSVLTTGAREEEEHENGVRVIRIQGAQKPKSIIGYTQVLVKLFMKAMKLEPRDLVITMTDPPMLLLAGNLLKKYRNVHHIHWCHDLYPDLLPVMGYKLPGFIMRFLSARSRKAMKNADGVVAIGHCMARYLVHHGVHSQQISVLPNWPDPILIQSGQNADTPEPDIHHMPTLPKASLKAAPKFRVLYAGNIGKAHTVKTIIEAASLLKDAQPDIEFVFAGDGSGFDKLEKERARRCLSNIRFVPYQPDSGVKTMMQSGDLHLVSMRKKTAGLLVPSKLYAAFAVGRPVIFLGPEGTEAAKVIREYGAGHILPNDDPQALADAIAQYRMNSDTWFKAHDGALKAREQCLPEYAIKNWIACARRTLDPAGDPYNAAKPHTP